MTQFGFTNVTNEHVSREQLRCVLVHCVELPPHVVREVLEGLVDAAEVGEPRCLVVLLPGLDVHDREAGVQGVLEVLERGDGGQERLAWTFHLITMIYFAPSRYMT